MASIQKHGDGYRAQVFVRGQRKSAKFATRRQAVLWAQRTELELEAGIGVHTFADAVRDYMANNQKRGKVWEQRRLNAMLEHFGPVNLVELDSPQIAKWRDTRLKSVSASTVVRESNLLKHLLHTARDEWRWIEHDPFRGVKLPTENPPRHQRWTWQLIKRVLRAGQYSGHKTREVTEAFHIALRTGMRLQEVLKAPEGFDAKRRVVVIHGTKTEARAEIPVGRIAAKLLQRPAFVVQPNEASVLFGKLTRQLLIDGLRFHDARATALTLLARKVDVYTLAKISRHKDISLLVNVYYRATPEDIAQRL